MTPHDQLKQAMSAHPARQDVELHTQPLTRKRSVFRPLLSPEPWCGFILPIAWVLYCAMCFTGHAVA